MAEIQNKAPQTARDRLAQISHHFLSDAEVPVEQQDAADEDIAAAAAEHVTMPLPEHGVYTIALLKTASDNTDLPVFVLGQQLAASGRSSAILDCNTGNMVSFMNDPQQTRTVHSGLTPENLEDATRRLGNKPHDVHFLLVDTADAGCLATVNRVLVTAAASSAGLQRSYSAIKQLAENNEATELGVTITEVPDAIKAEEAFATLASAVQRFLDRDLLSYGYLPPTPGINGQVAASRPVLMPATRPGIATIAEIISDEISEWQQKISRKDDNQHARPTSPAPENEVKNLNIKSVTITSNQELMELVTEALADILGHSYELVNENQPSGSNHILALNEKKQPFVIAFDTHDGVRALLSGLAVLDGLSQNHATLQRLSAMIQRLHPDVYNGSSQSLFRIEDTRLIVLSPNPPPGGAYLTHTLDKVSFYTFHALQVEDKTGLLIEPCATVSENLAQQKPALPGNIAHAFRGGKSMLTEEESAFFQGA